MPPSLHPFFPPLSLPLSVAISESIRSGAGQVGWASFCLSFSVALPIFLFLHLSGSIYLHSLLHLDLFFSGCFKCTFGLRCVLCLSFSFSVSFVSPSTHPSAVEEQGPSKGESCPEVESRSAAHTYAYICICFGSCNRLICRDLLVILCWRLVCGAASYALWKLITIGLVAQIFHRLQVCWLCVFVCVWRDSTY